MPNITCDYCFQSVDEFKMVIEKVLSDDEDKENKTLLQSIDKFETGFRVPLEKIMIIMDILIVQHGKCLMEMYLRFVKLKTFITQFFSKLHLSSPLSNRVG